MIRLLCASAERTGLADASVDFVTCAQSFHWFNPRIALVEFARVLVPGGAVVLTWNNRDRWTSSLVGEFEALVRRYNPSYDADYRRQDWAGEIDQTGLFESPQYLEFDWEWVRTPDEFVRFTRSISYIRNVVRRDQIGRFEQELEEILRKHANGGPVRIPMRTDLWIAVHR